MALFKPDTLASSNPKSFSIVYAEEVGGHKVVDDLSTLYKLSEYKDSIIIGSKTEKDAEGQLWWVKEEKCFYQLIDIDNISNSKGWSKTNIKASSSGTVSGDQTTGDNKSLLQIIGIGEDGSLSSSSYSLSSIDAPIISTYNLALSSYTYSNLQGTYYDTKINYLSEQLTYRGPNSYISNVKFSDLYSNRMRAVYDMVTFDSYNGSSTYNTWIKKTYYTYYNTVSHYNSNNGLMPYSSYTRLNSIYNNKMPVGYCQIHIDKIDIKDTLSYSSVIACPESYFLSYENVSMLNSYYYVYTFDIGYIVDISASWWWTGNSKINFLNNGKIDNVNLYSINNTWIKNSVTNAKPDINSYSDTYTKTICPFNSRNNLLSEFLSNYSPNNQYNLDFNTLCEYSTNLFQYNLGGMVIINNKVIRSYMPIDSLFYEFRDINITNSKLSVQYQYVKFFGTSTTKDITSDIILTGHQYRSRKVYTSTDKITASNSEYVFFAFPEKMIDISQEPTSYIKNQNGDDISLYYDDLSNIKNLIKIDKCPNSDISNIYCDGECVNTLWEKLPNPISIKLPVSNYTINYIVYVSQYPGSYKEQSLTFV